MYITELPKTIYTRQPLPYCTARNSHAKGDITLNAAFLSTTIYPLWSNNSEAVVCWCCRALEGLLTH